eukprot:7384296-Pyramimonas_sp.AAC.1
MSRQSSDCLARCFPSRREVASARAIASLAEDNCHELLRRLDRRRLIGHVATALDCATVRALVEPGALAV